MAGVENRIALVTGAGRGIGEAVAKTLAERGARVMAVARSEAELKALGMDYVVADLGTAAGCSRAVEESRPGAWKAAHTDGNRFIDCGEKPAP